MAKKPKKTEDINIEQRYKFSKETPGTWAYAACDDDGDFIDLKANKISGSNMLYLQKSEFPKQPCKYLKVTINCDD